MLKMRKYKPRKTRRLFVYDRKTGRKRRIDQKLSRILRRSAKVRRRKGKKLKQSIRVKISKALKKAHRVMRTKWNRRVKWKRKARKSAF